MLLSFEHILQIVDQEIGKIHFNEAPRSLFEPIEYTLSLGGKRIRPTLTLMACNVYSNHIDEAINPAMALEVFHNFTLLHDDLMDQADMRRNMPTVHKKWDTNTAILSGDAMLIAAYRIIGETPYLKKVLDIFTQTALEICCGQQYDMTFETRDNVQEDEYIEMIRLKTAVLIACCLKIGAIIGGAPAHDADRLYKFGIYMGLAFQLQDDLLDVYGDPRTFGKKIGGDILCDKKTFLLIHAMRLANQEQKGMMAYFKDSRNKFTPEEKIQAYIDIYNQLGIKELTTNSINQYYDRAMIELDSLQVNHALLAELIEVTKKLMQRKS